ncbi:MAG: anti-sigma factor antagonist [Lachnospiraceae bacterium]|nr:anti-sigma factor antagonist [Lachnospiraceae bacterium]
MKTNIESDILTVYLEGRIDSNNAEDMEKELTGCVESHNTGIVLDAEGLTYISSAGLRVLMKIQKSRKDKLMVINASPVIYDIFETTGFTEIMKVHKTIREIKLSSEEVIGRGATATVYRMDDDTVVKVFNNRISLQMVLREREFARKAFLVGIPALITYDVVKIKDCFGIVLEMAKGSVLSEKLNNVAVDKADVYKNYAGLLKTINNTHMKKGEFPNAKDIYHRYVDAATYLDEEQKKKLHKLINTLPDKNTILHGDFHANNVMYQDGEMVVIDLTDVSCGSPLFDLASMYVSHIAVGGYNPDFIKAGMGITYDMCLTLWDEFLKNYFSGEPAQEIEQKKDLIRRFAMLKQALMYTIAPGLDRYLGWKPFEDACKVLFDAESYSQLIEDLSNYKEKKHE